jgi:hypothetical protein
MEMIESDMKDQAQRFLKGAPAAGSLWRHYKGGEYRVLAACVREDTLEPLVLYRSLARGTCWARTLENWRQTVLVDGQQVPRFTQLEEGEA